MLVMHRTHMFVFGEHLHIMGGGIKHFTGSHIIAITTAAILCCSNYNAYLLNT